MARIKDIASMAGVSEATVSRVLNGTARVNRDTEEKVLRAIKKFNYRPNMLARGLRQKDGRLIGLFVPDIHHPTFSLIAGYVEKYSRQKGLNLMIGSTGFDPDIEAGMINDMLDRNANGIIALRVSNRSYASRVIKNHDIPFILLDRAEQDSPLPYVMTDNIIAGRMAAEYLHAKGHHEIICVTGPRDVSVVDMRMRGFVKGLEERGGSLPAQNIFEGDFSFESGRLAAEKIIEEKHPATAIWAQNDPMALGIMHQYIKSGFSVPRDISVMGMDNIDLASQFIPGLTTISQPFEEMCSRAVLHIAEPGNGRKKHVILKPGLIERDSVMNIL